MSKASRINKNKLQIYNLLRALQGIHPKQVQRKEMTLKHYKVMRRRLDKLEREKEKVFRLSKSSYCPIDYKGREE